MYKSCGIECFEGTMLEPCLLQPCYHVAGLLDLGQLPIRRWKQRGLSGSTANLRTKIMDFRVLDSSIILMLRGGLFHVHREYPGKFESSNLSRDILSREIGRRGGLCYFHRKEGGQDCRAKKDCETALAAHYYYWYYC